MARYTENHLPHMHPSRKAEAILDFVSRRPSSLEDCTLTEKVRERFAIGFWAIFEMDHSWGGPHLGNG
jgi:hypothetical protein